RPRRSAPPASCSCPPPVSATTAAERARAPGARRHPPPPKRRVSSAVTPRRDRGFRATSRLHPLDLDTEARSRRAGRASAASVPRELGGHVVEPLLTVDDADGELVVDVEVVGDVDELPHPGAA